MSHVLNLQCWDNSHKIITKDNRSPRYQRNQTIIFWGRLQSLYKAKITQEQWRLVITRNSSNTTKIYLPAYLWFQCVSAIVLFRSYSEQFKRLTRTKRTSLTVLKRHLPTYLKFIWTLWKRREGLSKIHRARKLSSMFLCKRYRQSRLKLFTIAKRNSKNTLEVLELKNQKLTPASS